MNRAQWLAQVWPAWWPVPGLRCVLSGERCRKHSSCVVYFGEFLQGAAVIHRGIHVARGGAAQQAVEAMRSPWAALEERDRDRNRTERRRERIRESGRPAPRRLTRAEAEDSFRVYRETSSLNLPLGSLPPEVTS